MLPGTNFVQLWAVLAALVAGFLPHVAAAEQADHGPSSNSGTVPTVTIMDLLSSNANFSRFILSLQHSGLVDTINEYANVTVLAPLNAAFNGTGQPYLKFNRTTLERFIVDEPVVSKDVHGVQIYKTLDRHGSPYEKGISVPILFDRSFSAEPGDDFYIEDGRVSAKLRDLVAPASNSVVQGIDTLLTNTKKSICEYFEDIESQQAIDVGGSHSAPLEEISFKLFAHLFNAGGYCEKNKLSNVTVLLPSDFSAVRQFDDIEYAYLLSDRGVSDRKLILENYILDGFYGGNINQTVAKNLLGNNVTLNSRHLGQQIVVNNISAAASSNYVLSDGILHYFDHRVLQSPQLPVFTPRSYLVGLNQTDFIDELDFRKLSYLIDDVAVNQTIFVVRDSSDVTANGQLKNDLLYQFADGKLELDHDMLVDSKFCTQASLGHCQKLKITMAGGVVLVNDHSAVYPQRYEVGNTYIYLVDDDVSTPPRLENALGPMDRCARTLQFMNDFGLLKFKSNGGHGYTVFLPTSDAWNSLDLTLDYLQANLTMMEMVLRNMQLNARIYNTFEGERIVTTGNGNKVILQHNPDDPTITIDGNAELPFTFAGEILFKDGVAYPVNRVLVPDSVPIKMTDLITTADADAFVEILDVTGFGDLIDNANYSFIVPSTATLLMENITAETRSIEYLQEFAALHVLPGDSLDKVLNCESEIPTLLNDTHLQCHRLASGGLTLSILEGNDHETRILRKGFTSNDTGLFLIDKPINPNWLDSHNQAPIRLHLPVVAMLVGVIIGMTLLAVILSCCFILTVGKNSKTDEEEELLGNGVSPDGTTDESSFDQEYTNTRGAGSPPRSPPRTGTANTALANTGGVAVGTTPAPDRPKIVPQKSYGSTYDSRGPVQSDRAPSGTGRLPIPPKNFSERYSTHSTTAAMDCPRVG